MKKCTIRLRGILCLLLCIAMLLSSGSIGAYSLASESEYGMSASGMHEIRTKCRTEDGNQYKVTVQFGDDAGIPSDACLAVEEIPATDERYDDYLHKTQSVLQADDKALSFACLLDISIVDKSDPDIIHQPSLGSTVDVRISMTDADEQFEEDVSIIHFAGRSEVPTVMENVEVDDGDIHFETDGFSAYAIVDGPSIADVDMGWEKLSSVDEIRALADEGLYIGHIDGFYFTNQPWTISSSRTGIAKTYPAEIEPAAGAVPYYFEFTGEDSNQFKAYCYDDNNQKQYVKQNGNSLVFVAQNQATTFTIEPFPNVPYAFQIKSSSGYCWNMQGGVNNNASSKSGKSFAAYQSEWDNNAKIAFWNYEGADYDLYDLDGRTVGLLSYSGHLVGKAMMASELDGGGALESLNMVVLEQENDRDDKVFVTNDTDITEWTFEWVESDRYYLKANAGGSLKYLQITDNGLALVSVPDDDCALRVIPGTGNHRGQICLKSGNNTLTYSGSVSTGFSTGGSVGSEWLNFVEMTDLTPDYLMTYSARKVSVSDTSVTNGSHIILYTRIWNASSKRYEIYAVDHDGSLVPCYDAGDSIKWVGNRINTLLWNFVEYYWEGTNDPNYYYELYNPYSEKFIAPQVTDGQILSDSTIGINLNGRRNGYYYTPIVAWDDDNYSYAGLNVNDDQIASCMLNQTADFYFAIIQEEVADDSLTLVDTVDNNQYGITMKMIDFTAKANNSNSNPNEQDIFLNSSVGGAVTTTVSGLLSTNLGEDGYPFATWGNHESFSELYDSTKLVDANHLFIQSVYNATGYFEYDSTENFASLDQSSGNFKVYEELGTMDTGDRPTLKHGQFMPFNDIEAGYFSSLNPKNLYNALAQELPNSDPRKSEQMYLVRNPDYYFGMELEASFVQTPNGHDAWGHDIIYEFTGDDDFWLYVDGELVIDLGGIHSALAGNVNFCTGEVFVNGTSTTLYELFYNNYLGREDPETGVQHTAAEAQAYVDDIFEQNENGQWVFKDYTTHTMRIFYMERGAGASNLHMRFNLASVKPGTVLLSKELGNVDEPETIHAEYPYQIWYKKAEDENDYLLTEDNLNIKVYYKDTITPVTYKPTLTIDGITYNSVFILKPTEIAEINLPDDAISYRIVECGINTDVYSSVSVNGTAVTGTPAGNSGNREDYGIVYETAKLRPRVNYRNNVNPAALRDLTIRKVLYDETGLTELHNDPATFGIRLYLGAEYEDSPSLTNMASYHVKNEAGEYCVWNATQQRFDSLGAGKTDYTQLTAAEKAAATFTTSMNGSISKIPAFYTIEVRELLAGTQYMVQERDYEIPDGYSLQKYVLYLDGLGTTGTNDTDPVQGTIESNKDPHVDVCNLKGWGLRINKRWSDAAYMSQRGPAYFGVYTGTSEQNLTLVPGTLRQMTMSENTLYWYFQTLPVPVPFEQYEIREVAVTNPTVDANGYVTSYSSAVAIPNGDTVTISGTQIGETSSSNFEYTVLYSEGTIDEDSNVRVDTATNNRPGIELRKAQWDGTTPLAGAQFALKDDTDTLIGTFTSDADGLITIAFLRDNVDYTLSEIKTPQGYIGPGSDIILRLSNGTVTVSGVGSEYYTLTQGAGITPTLVVKNRTRSFSVVKKDADSDAPLAGVHFALHRQVTIGGVSTIDFNPMPGYEDLVTDANGLIPRLNNTLPAGTYELRESSALAGYQALSTYIRFTISETGAITMGSHPSEVTLTETLQQDGSLVYTLTIPNSQRINVSIWKTDLEHTAITTGASFALYRAADFSDALQSPAANAQPVITGTTDENGILSLGGLEPGEYRLLETAAPEGYALPITAICITVTSGSVTATQSGQTSEVVRKNDANGYWVAGQPDDTWQIRVWNLTGVPMPFIGGPGTYAFYFGGGTLVLLAAFIVLRRRRRASSYA